MAIPRETQNHTLGRGEVHFALFKPGTQDADGFRYFGNTPELNLTIESENLDHYSSDRGIREKDDSVPLETNRTGSLITDHISPGNIALFFFGSSEVLTQASVSDLEYEIEKAKAGMSYQIGESRQTPSGHAGLTAVTVTAGATALVLDTDYEIDLDTGFLSFSKDLVALQGDGADVTVGYDLRAMSRTQVISGSQPVEGSIRYKSYNPKGDRIDFYLPWVKLSPNGDYALKGDEWQQIPLTLEILKRADMEAIYANGRPVYTA